MHNRLPSRAPVFNMRKRIEELRPLATDGWGICWQNPPHTQEALAAMAETDRITEAGETWRAVCNHGKYVLVLC
jgi:hypothetical protein